MAIGTVGVVRDGEALDALVSQVVHPLPEPLRVLGMKAREGDRRKLVASLEDHVAMQVSPVVGGGGVFVGDEGREAAASRPSSPTNTPPPPTTGETCIAT